MEIVIENMTMIGFSKVYKTFKEQITGYYVDNKTNTVNVFLGSSSQWKICTFNSGVYLTNNKSKITLTIECMDFNQMIIQ